MNSVNLRIIGGGKAIIVRSENKALSDTYHMAACVCMEIVFKATFRASNIYEARDLGIEMLRQEKYYVA